MLARLRMREPGDRNLRADRDRMRCFALRARIDARNSILAGNESRIFVWPSSICESEVRAFDVEDSRTLAARLESRRWTEVIAVVTGWSAAMCSARSRRSPARGSSDRDSLAAGVPAIARPRSALFPFIEWNLWGFAPGRTLSTRGFRADRAMRSSTRKSEASRVLATPIVHQRSRSGGEA